jgi:hypothetical protein
MCRLKNGERAARPSPSGSSSGVKPSIWVRASRTASLSESNRWPEIVIVLLSSRAFHIHSRRWRPTGKNCTFIVPL